MDQEPLKYDWEALRAKIVADGGIRHATMVATMPLREPPRVMTGICESIYPVFDSAFYAKYLQNKQRD